MEGGKVWRREGQSPRLQPWLGAAGAGGAAVVVVCLRLRLRLRPRRCPRLRLRLRLYLWSAFVLMLHAACHGVLPARVFSAYARRVCAHACTCAAQTSWACSLSHDTYVRIASQHLKKLKVELGLLHQVNFLQKFVSLVVLARDDARDVAPRRPCKWCAHAHG